MLASLFRLLLPRISTFLAQSMLSPCSGDNRPAQHLNTGYRKCLDIPTKSVINKARRDSHAANLSQVSQLSKVSISDHRIIDNLSRYAIAWLRAIHTSRADVMPAPLQS